MRQKRLHTTTRAETSSAVTVGGLQQQGSVTQHLSRMGSAGGWPGVRGFCTGCVGTPRVHRLGTAPQICTVAGSMGVHVGGAGCKPATPCNAADHSPWSRNGDGKRLSSRGHEGVIGTRHLQASTPQGGWYCEKGNYVMDSCVQCQAGCLDHVRVACSAAPQVSRARQHSLASLTCTT